MKTSLPAKPLSRPAPPSPPATATPRAPLSRQESSPRSPSATPATSRRDDADTFMSLLGMPSLQEDPVGAPTMPLDAAGFAATHSQAETTDGVSAPSPVWQTMTPKLTDAIQQAGPLPAAMDIMMPQLGMVNALMDKLPGGGLDLALAFAPHAFPLVKGAELLCGKSLAQRLGNPVLLRFLQRQS